ncbi:diacylglycerol/lipid kinase family protein [Parasphaerochaeta coccoides]|uniref:DAGKc domain-containing protein n=1 Tax=Parasphaerochaeta coccoides (strain ATCC BAA-1237 / DSM 17374 / SPN1) TaxID=760011 RepID=F4GM70_PARC1|nr:YegS/Rv2252/BmrU family lipid kinase [Parasphaerochaeta coccoides]AEC03046.1 Conserved hypothetical protein CHP00147 [Parasphaerochaeta coccoides DSM 17374]
MPEAYIILNPQAAKGHASRKEGIITAYLNRHGWKVRIDRTAGQSDGMRLARQAVRDGRPLIIAAGGDGTVNEVVDGIYQEDIAQGGGLTLPSFGVIPIGRGNDFAYAAGIPAKTGDACARLVHGSPRDLDIGIVRGGDYPEGRCFVNGVGVGFEPLVNFRAMEFKHINGMPSYVLGLLKVLARYPQPWRIRITLDGGEYEVDTQQISICNGRRMGSAFLMGPEASLDDGLFDVTFARRPFKGLKIMSLVPLFLTGRQIRHSSFHFERTAAMTISTDAPVLPVHADGEVISYGCTGISVEMSGKKLKIMI